LGFFSGVEREDEVYSQRQLEARGSRLKLEREESGPTSRARPPAPQPRKPLADKPVSVTASLFHYQERIKPQPTARPRADGKENGNDGPKVRRAFLFLSFFLSFFLSQHRPVLAKLVLSKSSL
jgi:hypothetical protein